MKGDTMLKKIQTTLLTIAAIVCLSHSVEAKTIGNNLLETDLVKTLIDLTVNAHPSIGLDERLASVPKTGEEKNVEETIKQNQIGYFELALKENKELTPEQKLFVTANYDKLGIIADKKIAELEKADLPIEKWVRESLQQSYSKKFTNKELTGLITFFQRAAGKRELKFLKNSPLSDAIEKNGGQPLHTKREKAEHNKFAATAPGNKFLSAFLDDTKAYVEPKQLAVWGGYGEPAMLRVLNSENLNKLINQFVKANYKK